MHHHCCRVWALPPETAMKSTHVSSTRLRGPGWCSNLGGNVLTRPFREISVNRKGRSQVGGGNIWKKVQKVKPYSLGPSFFEQLIALGFIFAQFLHTHQNTHTTDVTVPGLPSKTQPNHWITRMANADGENPIATEGPRTCPGLEDRSIT